MARSPYGYVLIPDELAQLLVTLELSISIFEVPGVNGKAITPEDAADLWNTLNELFYDGDPSNDDDADKALDLLGSVNTGVFYWSTELAKWYK